MSEEEYKRITQQDEEGADVEAHSRGGHHILNSDEPADEAASDDDDFEAHKKTSMI